MTGEPWVFVLPGFTRQPRHLATFVRECETHTWRVEAIGLAPSIFPILYMWPPHLRSIASSIGAQAARAPIVIVGHSAGAAAGVYITAHLRSLGADIRGLVIVDGVDSPNHLIRHHLSKLSGLRIAAVLAPPSPCNRQGLLAANLQEQPEVRIEIVPGAGHGDIEGAGVSMYRRVCKDSSSAELAAKFRDQVRLSIEWVLGEA